MGLRFSQIDRSVIKMLFVRGLAGEINNIVIINGVKYHWELIQRSKCECRSETYYDVGFSHKYGWQRCETLDEAMDRLEQISREVELCDVMRNSEA